MQFKIFTISILDQGEAQDEMNKFLRSHRVVDVEKYFFNSENNGYWSFCIRYLEGGNEQASEKIKKSKVDYKKVLDPEIFDVFSMLRECRKKIADKNAVPVYTIFTNEELSAIAKLEEMTVDNLISIEGIGKKRAEKYGKALIDLYNQMK